MHISRMDSLILSCAFLLLLAIDTGLAQQTDMYSQTSLLTSPTPNQPTPKLDTDDEGWWDDYAGLIILPAVLLANIGLACICAIARTIIDSLRQRLRRYRERRRPARRRYRERRRAARRARCPWRYGPHWESAPPSADDQQPPLSPAPVNDHQPNQQEILVYSIQLWKRRPAPPPTIPAPPYSDTSPRQGPAPPPPIPPLTPPPSYSDAMSLPLDYRHTRDSDPCRGPPYITHM